MHETIRNIEPTGIWNNFTNLNAVPRASKNEERVIAFMVSFGKSLGLETLVDNAGNVIIKKKATIGMKNRKSVVLQSHLDMVHQKNNDTLFDFDKEGIQMQIDGDWVKAKGTTLGADNGLGVATIMSILESKNIEHPAIEALFTIDEETGMTGAKNLDPSILQGDILLNLDTEDDDEIGVGCAGGIDITASKKYQPESIVNSNLTAYKIVINGLQGGHSGMDIHKGYGNANKLLNRVLFSLCKLIQVAEIDGGSLRNAIPRESQAVVLTEKSAELKEAFALISNEILGEYKTIENELKLSLDACGLPKTILPKKTQSTLIRAIYAIPNGVFRMSPDIDNLVETSNNLARVIAKDGVLKIMCLTRSSVESGKMNLVNSISSGLEMADFKVILSGDYPGWKPNPKSEILGVMKSVYQNLFNEEPKVLACHAGLECGILLSHYPKMDMISFGPTIKGAHSPDEKASISSTAKYWEFVLAVLKNIPKKS